MAKNIIHIYGASGSGTTTIGKYVCDKLGYFHMDTDDYFWLPTNPPYTTKRDVDERIKLILDDFNSHDNVLLSGSIAKWGAPLVPHFTLAVRVVTPTDVRIDRVHKREFDNFGNRILPGGDMHQAHLEFIEWLSKYDTAGIEMRSKAQHDLFESRLTCQRVTVDGTQPLELTLETIQKLLND